MKSTGFLIKTFEMESWLHAYQILNLFNIHNMFKPPFPHWQNEANRIFQMSFEVIATRIFYKARGVIIVITSLLFSL